MSYLDAGRYSFKLVAAFLAISDHPLFKTGTGTWFGAIITPASF
jgi:hypothetical protein